MTDKLYSGPEFVAFVRNMLNVTGVGRDVIAGRLADLGELVLKLGRDHDTMLETLTKAQEASTRDTNAIRAIRWFTSGEGAGMRRVLEDVLGEVWSADYKWGRGVDRPDGTATADCKAFVLIAKGTCDAAMASNTCSWKMIAEEEMAEAFAESDPALLRAELLQVAATSMRWACAIDARKHDEPTLTNANETV